MSTKKECVSVLEQELKARGFFEEFSDPCATKLYFNREFMNAVEAVIPEKQISKMIEMLQERTFSTAADVYDEYRVAGLLHVEPTIMKDGKSKVPSLVLGWGKYLHWFRGYHFQVSGTHSGVGSVYSGADRLDIALRYCYGFSAAKFVFVGCLVPVLCYFEQGMKLLEFPNNKLLDDFVRMSGELEYLHDTCMDDFMKFVSVKEYCAQPAYPADFDGVSDDDFAIRVLDDSLGYGLLTIGEDFITFTTHPKEHLFRTRRIQLPDWFKEVCSDEECSKVWDHKIIYQIIIRALMTLSGFRADYLCMYPMGTKRGDIRRLDYNLPDEASAWDDIDEYVDKAVERYFPYEAK